MQGYSLDRFSEPVDSELICDICKCVMKLSTQVDCEKGHLFCQDCLKDKPNVCTVCHSSFTNSVPSFLHQRKISVLKILCSNHMLGCTYNDKILNIDSHELNCSSKKIPCRYNKFGCDEFNLPNVLVEHEEKCAPKHLNLILSEVGRHPIFMNGPLKVTGHPHELELCGELESELCNHCMSPIKKFNESYIGYLCKSSCNYCICIYCISKLLVIKTKNQIKNKHKKSGEKVSYKDPDLANIRVIRGPNWRWGDQDGGEGKFGTILNLADTPGWARTKWDSGITNTYRIGAENEYDLSYA